MAFALTMIILLVALCGLLLGTASGRFGSAGSGLVATTQNANQSSARTMNATVAFNDAESGVEYTLEWLHQQSAPPSTLTPFAPASMANASYTTTTPSRALVPMSVVDPNSGSTVSYGNFTILIYPDQGNNPNNAAYTGQMKYLIESTGAYNGVSQIVTAYVAQQSFGGYAYFTDQDTNATWTCGTNSFSGPVHTNHASTAGRKVLWFSSGTQSPLFQYSGADAYTTSYSSIDFRENSAGTTGSPSTAAQWLKIAQGGQGTVHTGVASIPMPTSSTKQLNAALGSATAPSGTTPSVLVPSSGGAAAGGIYIHGNVTQMTLTTANGGTTQSIEIDQPSTGSMLVGGSLLPTSIVSKTYVSLNPTTNTTSSYTTSSTAYTLNGVTISAGVTTGPMTTLSGTTNGVIYCDGNIGSQGSDSYPDSATAYTSGNGASHGSTMTGGVSGVIADNTLDSNGNIVNNDGLTIATSSSNDINIDGNLTTYSPLSSANANKVGSLGLLANTIEVTDKDASGNAITSETVDAAILAFNTIDGCDITSRTAGSFTLNGGYIAEVSGVFGIINSNTGALQTGLAQHFNYDSRFATNPPPYFPTTSTNYNVLSWQQVSAPLITSS